MRNVRRTLGGFVVAAMVAAALVMTPASLYAKPGNGNGGGVQTGSVCDALIAYRNFLIATYEEPLLSYLLGPVNLAISIANCE